MILMVIKSDCLMRYKTFNCVLIDKCIIYYLFILLCFMIRNIVSINTNCLFIYVIVYIPIIKYNEIF